MKKIKLAKVEQLMKQFEQQLHKDAVIEQQRVKEHLEEAFEVQVNELEAEKKSNTADISKLQQQLDE